MKGEIRKREKRRYEDRQKIRSIRRIEQEKEEEERGGGEKMREEKSKMEEGVERGPGG